MIDDADMGNRNYWLVKMGLWNTAIIECGNPDIVFYYNKHNPNFIDVLEHSKPNAFLYLGCIS